MLGISGKLFSILLHCVKFAYVIFMSFAANRRILSMLDPVREKVAYGGIHDEQDRYIAPTLITDVTADDGIMSEEIFGPLLPFVVVESGDKAIEFIRKR